MSDRQGGFPRRPPFYVPSNTTLERMQKRTNMFLMGPVAAVLVFITFIGALTTVKGFNIREDTLAAQKLGFIVFILSDTYAFCCSMLVLFFLRDAMVCNPEDPKASVLIDRGVVLLEQSLYGTMMSFMSGIVTMTNHMLIFISAVIVPVAFILPNWRVLFGLNNPAQY